MKELELVYKAFGFVTPSKLTINFPSLYVFVRLLFRLKDGVLKNS